MWASEEDVSNALANAGFRRISDPGPFAVYQGRGGHRLFFDFQSITNESGLIDVQFLDEDLTDQGEHIKDPGLKDRVFRTLAAFVEE